MPERREDRPPKQAVDPPRVQAWAEQDAPTTPEPGESRQEGQGNGPAPSGEFTPDRAD